MHTCLVVTKKCHRKTTRKTKISKKTIKPYHFSGSKSDGAIFNFATRTSYNMLPLATPSNKVTVTPQILVQKIA